MSSDRQSVPVSLPSELVARLDRLVEAGVYSSRSEALRYGARLVVRWSSEVDPDQIGFGRRSRRAGAEGTIPFTTRANTPDE